MKLKFFGEVVPFVHGTGVSKDGKEYEIDMWNGYRSEGCSHSAVITDGKKYNVRLAHKGRYQADDIWEIADET